MNIQLRPDQCVCVSKHMWLEKKKTPERTRGNTTHNEEECQSAETDPELRQILELVDSQHFK